MDEKALRKSKRAHSLHHSRKPHPNQSSKPSSASTSASHASLPSNWNRYHDVFDSDSENPSGHLKAKSSDVVLPKSKGSDFCHLITEAQSQSQSQSQSPSISSYLDILPALPDDDPFAGDLCHLGPMLSARGEAIVSLTSDDNFMWEDERTAVNEMSFLSLNLHTLAEQLDKVDVSKRLFIEADLLSELNSNGSRPTSSLETDQFKTNEIERTTMLSEELTFYNLPKNKSHAKGKPSVSAVAECYGVSTSHDQESPVQNHVKNGTNSHRDHRSIHDTEHSVRLDTSSKVESTKLFSCEAAAAEAELDMLLDSFTETRSPDSADVIPASSTFSKEESPSVLPHFTRNVHKPSTRASIPTNLDDELDDLLEETSRLSDQYVTHQPSKGKVELHEVQFSSESVHESRAAHDFDSWLDTI
ncbi:hypothetical protein K2173_018817 [Erythroxylum novogranatense]|uniref:Uncharacterized protein n=1 Tax=Erythroxylum novogranatense TaxID=1862640 RepID=A0AAV8SBB1_9ROSI|nr:hypothetical protein K2173_018817 [Erythroxylum novogranatense]